MNKRHYQRANDPQDRGLVGGHEKSGEKEPWKSECTETPGERRVRECCAQSVRERDGKSESRGFQVQNVLERIDDQKVCGTQSQNVGGSVDD